MRIAGILISLALGICTSAHAESVAIRVQRAVVNHDEVTARDVVQVHLTPEGQRRMAAFTRERVGRTIHLRVGGTLLTSATVRGPIDGQSMQLSPGETGYGGTSAQNIAKRLNAGSTLVVSDE